MRVRVVVCVWWLISSGSSSGVVFFQQLLEQLLHFRAHRLHLVPHLADLRLGLLPRRLLRALHAVDLARDRLHAPFPRVLRRARVPHGHERVQAPRVADFFFAEELDQPEPRAVNVDEHARLLDAAFELLVLADAVERVAHDGDEQVEQHDDDHDHEGDEHRDRRGHAHSVAVRRVRVHLVGQSDEALAFRGAEYVL